MGWSPRGSGASSRGTEAVDFSQRGTAATGRGRRPPGRAPHVAAALSFLWPGLGQAASGNFRRGAVLALPALFLALVILLASKASPFDLIELALDPNVIAALLVVNVLFLLYRLVVILDAYLLSARARMAWQRTARGTSVSVLVALLLGTTLIHGVIGYVGYRAYEADRAILADDQDHAGFEIPEPSWGPDASGAPGQAAPTPSPTPTPVPGPQWAQDGRLNLLLIGSDNGPGRWSLRTDTMMVLSVDVATGRAALFGIPRNIVNVPLAPESANAFPCRCFPNLLNGLYVYAMGHPNQFPGGDARGFRAVTGAVQELVGVRLDGMIGVSLNGFVGLVNAIGGLWIDVPSSLHDDHYPLEDGSRDVVISINAGCQKLNGRMALAYARSRHQDSDYGRMKRQQLVIVALRKQLDPLKLLPQAADLLELARDNLFTTLKRSEIPGLARMASQVNPKKIKSYTFVPPKYPSYLGNAETASIRQVVRDVFVKPAAALPSGTPKTTAKPATRCG
jgi:LCP family protein required for cell wall assembly